jgi:hypothetical protein
MGVVYEWVLEEIDNTGDVVERDAHTSAGSAVAAMSDPRWTSLALVRDTFDSRDDGLVDRQYAYVDAGRLPEHFGDGRKVPQKLHTELDRACRPRVATA